MDYNIEDRHSNLKKVDCLRDRSEADKPVDYDDLKKGDYFFLQKPCPACNSLVLAKKEHDFQCQKCFLIFRYEKE